MIDKLTRKTIRSSDRAPERALFRAVLQQETSVRGLVLHSEGQGGTGKTTLLKMFEAECQSDIHVKSTTAIYFTAKIPLTWQKILDDTVNRLDSTFFPTYRQLRSAYADYTNELGRGQPTLSHVTHIHHVQGPVHTGSGDIGNIGSTSDKTNPEDQSPPKHSAEKLSSPEDWRTLLTQTFLRELSEALQESQLVWLIDTAERVDDQTKSWLIELFEHIVGGSVDCLVLVVAGRDRLCYEPYWMDKVEDLHIGNFSEKTVIEIVQQLWPTEHESLIHIVVHSLMERSGGRPQDLITHIESFNPYQD